MDMELKMYFEDYGLLKWLDPEEYWEGDWSIKGFAYGDDVELYDIVFSRREQEYRFTNV